MGTAMNKVLKDIIVKYKSMTGYNANYVPGWDCHGLPIELKAIKQIGLDSGTIDPVTLRKSCREFALSCLDGQKKQFKRLGVWGDFDNPYLTIKPEFEAKQVEVFGKMMQKGYIYKGLKPVYWCADCNTALAEAEIEYQDDPCYSIYVKFPISDSKGKFDDLGIDLHIGVAQGDFRQCTAVFSDQAHIVIPLAVVQPAAALLRRDRGAAQLQVADDDVAPANF